MGYFGKIEGGIVTPFSQLRTMQPIKMNENEFCRTCTD